MMQILLSPEPHSEYSPWTPALGDYAWGWPPDRCTGLRRGGPALAGGVLIRLGA